LAEDGTFAYVIDTLHFTEDESAVWESSENIRESESFREHTTSCIGIEPLEINILGSFAAQVREAHNKAL
jgi:hypothetical protein